MESEDMSRLSQKSTTIEDPLLQTELLVTSSDFQVEDPPAEPAVSSKMLAIYATLLLVAGVGNAIYYKKMTNHVQNYPYFLSQATTVAYLPVFGFVVWYEKAFTNLITDEMTSFPKFKFFVMGVFDALSGVLALFGGVYTSGNTQGLLNQGAVPITMILSYVVLKQRYSRLQVIGALVIMGGVITVLLPKFLDNNTSSGEDRPLFNIIFLLSVIPMALSSIYKELAFGTVDLDVNYMQFWVAVWQFVFGFCLIPLNTFSFLGPNAMPWDQLPSALWNGMRCFAGYNTIITACGGPDPQPPCDMCAGAWVPVTMYFMFNCAFNVFIILVIKHGSAALFYIVMTIRLPIVNLFFSWSVISDPPEALNKFTIFGLVIIIAGLVAYRIGGAASTENEHEILLDRNDPIPEPEHQRKSSNNQ